MIRSLMMKLGSTCRRVLTAGAVLFVLCLAIGLFYDDPENQALFLGLGGGGLTLAAVVWSSFHLRNRSKYQKLYDKVGEHGIQKWEEEYQRGERTREAVFGDTHLFVEPGCNPLGFDIIGYRQILWMYIHQHITTYEVIPVLRSWSVRIYLDDPERGRQQMVEVNARLIRKDPEKFFDRVIAKNPKVLLGYNPEWVRMVENDKEAFIRFVRR